MRLCQDVFIPVDDIPGELSDDDIFSVNSAYKLKEKLKRVSKIAEFRVFWGFFTFLPFTISLKIL